MLRLSIAAFAISLMAASCGQKGPLYLPESSNPTHARGVDIYNGPLKEQHLTLSNYHFAVQPSLQLN